MKFLELLLKFILIASVLVVAGSIPAERNYARKAVLAQRVIPSKGADLFGDSGTLVGSEQMLIIEDQRAFTGDVSETGAKIVNQSYLDEKGIYPLQLQTVRFVAGQVRLGAGAGILVGLLGLWLTSRRRSGAGHREEEQRIR